MVVARQGGAHETLAEALLAVAWAEGGRMSSNDDLATSVSEELFWNPVVDDASIAVFADDGRITLRGTVGSLREKREAEKAAQRVFGVVSVESRCR